MSSLPKPFSVVCLSLGGTKFEVGALTDQSVFLSSGEILWRSDPLFADFLEDRNASGFCTALAGAIRLFLDQHGGRLRDVAVFGFPFPGPVNGDRWYSNNLIPAFRKGVALQQKMAAALSNASGHNFSPNIRVLLDAQCDAGGELYHPHGLLLRNAGDNGTEQVATVLNIATGIAAGFIRNGRVLIDDDDIRRHVHPEYDGGAGQLGRHLWYDPADNAWRYRFRVHGRTPASSGIRMTERLSGPALAGRLLYRLGHGGFLRERVWPSGRVPLLVVDEVFRQIADADPDADCAKIAQTIRACSKPVASALLEWADHTLARSAAHDVDRLHTALMSFASDVTADLAAALRTWMHAPGWADYGRRIILTGGVGIRFFSVTAAHRPQRFSFLPRLQSALPEGCRVQRSRLGRATERECYLFRDQPPMVGP